MIVVSGNELTRLGIDTLKNPVKFSVACAVTKENLLLSWPWKKKLKQILMVSLLKTIKRKNLLVVTSLAILQPTAFIVGSSSAIVNSFSVLKSSSIAGHRYLWEWIALANRNESPHACTKIK